MPTGGLFKTPLQRVAKGIRKSESAPNAPEIGGEDICDGFQAPSQTCSLPYRLWSQRSAPALALPNSVATEAAQSADIVPFFAAFAAMPTACLSALMPFRISRFAFFLPLVPAASEISCCAESSRCTSVAGTFSPVQRGCERVISMAHPLVHAPTQVGPVESTSGP